MDYSYHLEAEKENPEDVAQEASAEILASEEARARVINRAKVVAEERKEE